ncbi:MAG: trypsin-like serine protease [Leptospirales bacterium]
MNSFVEEIHIEQALNALTGDPRQFKTKGAAVSSNEHKWMFQESVKAFGLAERVTEGQLLKDVALKVYVERKLPRSKISNPVPEIVNLNGLPPIPTDVEEVGRIQLHGNTQRVRPAPPGFSIGRSTDVGSTGTFGLVVRKKGQTSQVYLLSNSHAIADCGMATKGEPIIQPGAADQGTPANDTIAKLTQWIPYIFGDTGFPNHVDAAIAELKPDVATAAIAQLGIPTGVCTNPTRGMVVQKMGRTTTLSIAKVKDVHLRIAVDYPTTGGKVGRVGFSDQILTSFYTAPGDSGSAVLDMQSQVMGLHFAGSSTNGVSNKITNVLAALDLELVTTDGEQSQSKGE